MRTTCASVLPLFSKAFASCVGTAMNRPTRTILVSTNSTRIMKPLSSPASSQCTYVVGSSSIGLPAANPVDLCSFSLRNGQVTSYQGRNPLHFYAMSRDAVHFLQNFASAMVLILQTLTIGDLTAVRSYPAEGSRVRLGPLCRRALV